MALNETHDPKLSSWVASADAPGTDFPIQNLPLGVFRRAGSNEAFRGGIAIGDQIFDLAAALQSHRTAFAISSGRPTRPIGTFFSIALREHRPDRPRPFGRPSVTPWLTFCSMTDTWF